MRSFTPKAIKHKTPFYWGGYGINILGDSISHGAFSRDIYRNNWTNILKRCLNAEYGEQNYGFTSIVAGLGSGGTLSYEIHKVTRGAGWTAIQGTDAAFAISGGAFKSTTSGSIITVVVPTFMKKFGVWFNRVEGGGSFNIEVNGVVVDTVNTDAAGGAAGGYFLQDGFDLPDGGYGTATIRLITTNALPVSILGLSYEDDANSFQVNNFSQSGRRLAHVPRDVITRAVAGSSILIMALGHNDSGDAATDPAYLAAFSERIDWLISDSNTYGVPIVVPDFVWRLGPATAVRSELKRLAESANNGLYIPFPDHFKDDGAPPSTTEMTTTLKLFDDASHPNIEGHKLIGETVAKALRLGCSSKTTALMHHDFWNVIPLPAAGPIKNSSTTPGKSCAVRRSGDHLTFRGSLVNSASATALAGGTYPILEGALPGLTLGGPTVIPFMVNSGGSEIESYIKVRGGNAGVDLLVRSGNANVYHEGEITIAAKPFAKGDI